MAMDFFVLGSNHRTADVSLREQISLSQEKGETLIRRLLNRELVQEAVVLCTCNRVEVYGVSRSPVHQETILELLADTAGVTSLESSFFYFYRDQTALRHLFEVAGSLDSQIVGETHILGQVKSSYQRSVDLDATGKWLNIFFQKSFQVAKKIRTETNVAQLPVSTGSCAVVLAQKILGELKERRFLMVGAGEIGCAVAKHFHKYGVDLTVSNRTRSKARLLARKLGGTTIGFGQWQGALVNLDVVVFATQSTSPLLTSEAFAQVMRRRRNRPLLLLDLSVPRNVDPTIAHLESAFLYDIDAVQGLVTANQGARIEEAEKARTVIAKAARLLWRKMAVERATSLSLATQVS